MTKPSERSLLGKSLDGFTIKGLSRISMIDGLGRRTHTIGFFPDDIAETFIHGREDVRTDKMLVATNGREGFLLGEDAEILCDEKTASEALEKLKRFREIDKVLSELPPEDHAATLKKLLA